MATFKMTSETKALTLVLSLLAFAAAHAKTNTLYVAEGATQTVDQMVATGGFTFSADLLVTDGLVLLGMDTCLKPCDGFRILSDGSLRRYRSLSDGSAIRKSFLAGVSDIRIKERRRHAM